ncbi:MAG: PIN domain-containing protein [Pseudomonadota bacterium]
MAEGGADRRWFLDACVLYPQLLREIVLGAAQAGLITPFWSPRVLEEWRIAAARAGGMAAEAEVRSLTAEMAAAFPDAEVEPDPAVLAALVLPDAADVHVAAAAATAEAAILTLNIRDFPARRLAGHGLAAVHPDGALWALCGDAPEALAPVIDQALARLSRPQTDSGRNALKRSGLPRLGKAWASRAA